MKYQILLILLVGSFLYSTSVMASSGCSDDRQVSDTSANKIQFIVNQKNKQEKRLQKDNYFSNKFFGMSSLNFEDSKYTLYPGVIIFGNWYVSGNLGGLICYYPERQYRIIRNKQLSFQNQLSDLQQYTQDNRYSDGNSIYASSGSLIDGMEIYETGSINDIQYIVTYDVWTYDGSTHYSLWLIGKKYNYLFTGRHGNEYSDIHYWKSIIKTIKF